MKKTHKIYNILLFIFSLSSIILGLVSICYWDTSFLSNKTFSLALMLLAVHLFAINKLHYVTFLKQYHHLNFSFIIALLGGFQLLIFYISIVTLVKYYKHDEFQEVNFYYKMFIEFLSSLTAGSIVYCIASNYFDYQYIFSIDELSLFAFLIILYNVITILPSVLITHFDTRMSYKTSQNALLEANIHAFVVYFIYFSILLAIYVGFGFMGVAFMSVALFMTEQYIEQNHRIKIQSITDPLTGVYNRGYLDRTLQQFKTENRRFSIIMLDIDNFKDINETFNHLVGDMILKEFSEVIKSSLRTNDIVVRYGGEEFVVILENVSLQNTFMVADRIRYNIEKHVYTCSYNNKSHKVQHTSSIGIGVYNNKHPNNVIEEADNNLKVAKNTGKNKIYYHKEKQLNKWKEKNN